MRSAHCSARPSDSAWDYVGSLGLNQRLNKRIDGHIFALSPYFVFCNFVRSDKAHKVAPAMAGGVSNRLWSIDDIVALIDARAPTRHSSEARCAPVRRRKARPPAWMPSLLLVLAERSIGPAKQPDQ